MHLNAALEGVNLLAREGDDGVALLDLVDVIVEVAGSDLEGREAIVLNDFELVAWRVRKEGRRRGGPVGARMLRIRSTRLRSPGEMRRGRRKGRKQTSQMDLSSRQAKESA